MSPTPVDLTRAPTGGELDEALALLVESFFDDPFYVWFEPDVSKRRGVLEGLLSIALAGCSVHVAHDGGRAAGVLAWHEPELAPSRMATRETLAVAAHALRRPGNAYLGARVWSAIKARRPTDPAHVVVELFAVDRAARGRGRGRALLDALLARADARGWVVHLETTRPSNVAIYERFGFAPVGAPIVYGSSAPTFCLRRPTPAR